MWCLRQMKVLWTIWIAQSLKVVRSQADEGAVDHVDCAKPDNCGASGR